jgi:hypothetical protein
MPVAAVIPPAETSNRLAPEERLAAVAIAMTLLALLGVARWLEPDPSGVGTHTQLGLPPTFVMERFGTPCPLCGMTTSWAHTMEADLPAAFLTQPAGTLFALAAMALIPLALVMAASGWRPAWLAAPATVRWGFRIAVAVLAVGWVYKLFAVFTGFPG